MKFYKTFLLPIVGTLLFSVQISEAQNKVAGSVFGNGGAATSSSANRIVGTLGQPMISVASNATTIASGGFWYGSVDLITSVE